MIANCPQAIGMRDELVRIAGQAAARASEAGPATHARRWARGAVESPEQRRGAVVLDSGQPIR
jgi:hypothetical protein